MGVGHAFREAWKGGSTAAAKRESDDGCRRNDLNIERGDLLLKCRLRPLLGLGEKAGLTIPVPWNCRV